MQFRIKSMFVKQISENYIIYKMNLLLSAKHYAHPKRWMKS